MEIRDLYHVNHVTEDRPPLDAWYDDVFLPRRGFLDANYHDAEQLSLVTIADAVVEVLAPARFVKGWDTLPIGRFFNRFGRHWHSIAWYVDDIGDTWEHLRSHGLRVLLPGGAPGDELRPSNATTIFTHPKETLTQLQFYWRPPVRGAEEFATRGDDPRYLPGWWSGWWAEHHPLGIQELEYISIVTDDLDQARSVFVDALGGAVVGESSSALTSTDDVYVRVGAQTVIQIARPHDAPSLARADLDAHGSMLHAVAFHVRDLDAAERHLRDKGIGLVARDERTILASPDDTFGVPFRFVVRQ